MTYLDPSHPRSRNDATRWIVRILATAGILAFGWFALTVGTGPTGSPTIVQEPVNGGL
ncbi:hypothetical protein [Pelagibacterium limicola]|uniref:hypothetical protein n=1 Tax=Pelagibacterium limicola TaxID=2791022 RepID=UPI0018AFE40C|nr:hypothetical protein [Pelagibacterium limicola]